MASATAWQTHLSPMGALEEELARARSENSSLRAQLHNLWVNDEQEIKRLLERESDVKGRLFECQSEGLATKECLGELSAALETSRTKEAELQQLAAESQANLAQALADLASTRTERDEALSGAALLRQERDEAQRAERESTQQRQAQEQALAEAQRHRSEAQEAMREAQLRAALLEAQVKDLEASKAGAAGAAQIAFNSANSVQKQLDEERKKRQDLEGRELEFEREHKKTLGQVVEAQNRLVEAQRLLRDAEHDKMEVAAALNQQLASLKQQLQAAQQRIKELENHRSLLKEEAVAKDKVAKDKVKEAERVIAELQSQSKELEAVKQQLAAAQEGEKTALHQVEELKAQVLGMRSCQLGRAGSVGRRGEGCSGGAGAVAAAAAPTRSTAATGDQLLQLQPLGAQPGGGGKRKGGVVYLDNAKIQQVTKVQQIKRRKCSGAF